MNKIYAKIITLYLLLIGVAHAETIRGATVAEVNTRVSDTLVSVLDVLKVCFVVAGFAMFGFAVVRLQKITKGEIQGASPWSAILAMVVAAMMSSIGFWWIVTSNTVKKFFSV